MTLISFPLYSQNITLDEVGLLESSHAKVSVQLFFYSTKHDKILTIDKSINQNDSSKNRQMIEEKMSEKNIKNPKLKEFYLDIGISSVAVTKHEDSVFNLPPGPTKFQFQINMSDYTILSLPVDILVNPGKIYVLKIFVDRDDFWIYDLTGLVPYEKKNLPQFFENGKRKVMIKGILYNIEDPRYYSDPRSIRRFNRDQ